MEYRKRVMNLSERMRIISLEKEFIYLQARYGPSKIVKIPLELNEDLACLTGVIIGDGHLNKNKFITNIEVTNKELLDRLSDISLQLFDIKTKVIQTKKREGRMQTYHMAIYSKAVQELLNLVFDIPRGKKSDIADVPKLILEEDKKFQIAFIAGLLITEGSRKGESRLRIASASKSLLANTQKMLENIGIKSFVTKWSYPKHKREFYELAFKRDYLNKLIDECESDQTKNILDLFKEHIKEKE